VAVVMPSYNQAGFIEAAVASVFDQGLPGLRLLVQDGGSQDGTPGLLADLARRHLGLDWVSAPDDGPADALNRAVARALADPQVAVLGWLNSDDLYTPGALQRAMQHLAAHRDLVAVYGHGEHIDATGRRLGDYPTRGPDTPLAAWADGCHLCQPTMVLRREAVQAVWPLDATLRTAFDYDAWLRLFRRFPGRIGFVDALQARSRLHDAGITLSQRQRVALEAVQVIHRHLGPAPGHWLLTAADELLATLPDGDDRPALQRVMGLLDAARPHLAPPDAGAVLAHWQGHRGLRSALPQACVGVQADGWLLADTVLRVRTDQAGRLELHGRHPGQQASPLDLVAIDAQGGQQHFCARRPGPFVWTLDVPATGGTTQRWTLRGGPAFVPAVTEPGSGDQRALVWQLAQLRWRA
jgi:hypothetical protein